MGKKILKLIITDYKKITHYGDMEMEGDCFIRHYNGKAIFVKLFGLFWIEYKSFRLL